MARQLANLVESLATRLIAPVYAGGRVTPIPPIGERHAVALARSGPSIVGEAGATIDDARLRSMRRLVAVDEAPALFPGEWYLVAALNDLLQSTNPTLTGVFGGGRPLRAIGFADSCVNRAGAPSSLCEALSRHTLALRALDLRRIDTTVSFWAGVRTFRGARAPRRLQWWPRVRRVRRSESRVDLASMAPDEPWADAYERASVRWLCASPLTYVVALANGVVPRRLPGTVVSLVSLPAGLVLALRALQHAEAHGRIVGPLRGIASDPSSPEPSRRAALRVADAVEDRLRVDRRSESVRPALDVG